MSDWKTLKTEFSREESHALALLGLVAWCGRVEAAARAAAAIAPGEEQASEALVLALLGAVSLGKKLSTHLDLSAVEPAPSPGESAPSLRELLR